MFEYSTGYHAAFDTNGLRPVKPTPPRVFVQEHPLYDAEQWLKGYDAGLEACKRFREGQQAAKQGKGDSACPYGQDFNSGRQEWLWGFRKGRTKLLKDKLLPILKAAGKLGLVVCTVTHPDYDDIEGVEYRGGEKYAPLTKRELLGNCLDYLLGRYGNSEPVPQTVEDMVRLFICHGESDWGFVRVMTRKQAKKEQDEREYQKMEEKAQRFAASCGKPLGTKEFIRALEKAVKEVRYQRERWNNPERRMEEWAACRYAGVGSDVYFDDLNFENGRYESRLDDLQEVWNYLERKFPLMMLRYQEAKARRAEKSKK